MLNEHSYGIIPLRKKDSRWEVLLIQHGAGHWSFPKGHPNAGEEAHQAASRELQEETGLTVKQYLSEKSFDERYFFMSRGSRIHKVVTYYLAEVEGAVVIQVEEIRDSKWVPFEEVTRYITYPATKQVCEQAMQELMRR